MARPREYNKEEVLDAATELFWAKGYHGTSLSELVSATKLNKQSMYQEFGSKAGLFEACLEYYSSKMRQHVLGTLSQEPPSLANIHNLFDKILEYLSSPAFKGCMFVNTASEFEHIAEAAAARVRLFLDRLEEAFYNNLKAEFRARDARVRARYLVHMFTGVMTVGKAKPDRAYARTLIAFALKAIEE